MSTRTIPNSYVSVLDLLGFKDIVNNNSHEELLRIYKSLTTQITDSVGLYRFNKITTPEGIKIQPNLDNVFVNSITISDSVILWTNNTSTRSFFDLILTVWNLLSTTMHTGLPLRGGITVGPISLIDEVAPSNADNRHATFIGKSIVDAYSIEQKQEWSGCIISKNCIQQYEQELAKELTVTSDPERLKKAISLHSLQDRGFLMKHNVPVRDNKTSEEFVINWPRALNPKLSEQAVTESFGRNNKSSSDKSVQLKIKNTLDFWRITPDDFRSEISLKRK